MKDLSIAFRSRAIIRNLSFEVHEGDCVAIIGPNGAGKTVLLQALLRLIPYEGDIRWSHESRLGYVPQKIAADRQLPFSARDLLAAKAGFLKLPSAELEQVSTGLGLTNELLSASIGTLSGGQFQKILIAFALLGRPNVLLFDEPTGSLETDGIQSPDHAVGAPSSCRGLLASCSSRHSKHTSAWHKLQVSM